MSGTDLELLARYTRNHSEDAFAEIVRRHVDLVHSAALRQVRSPQLAEEISQSVFLKLARHAPQLAPNTIITAWLYQVTRREAVDVVRREARRQLREQIATEMNAMNATHDDWTHIEPLLDEAVLALDETDRAAVLLRYFENKSLREVGESLGTSENAAQKRLSRSVERLREFFAKRGVKVSLGGLAITISTNAVQAAPPGMAAAISTSAVVAATPLATTATFATNTVTKAIVMTTLHKTVIGATLAAALGTGIYEVHEQTQLRHEHHQIAMSLLELHHQWATNDYQAVGMHVPRFLRGLGDVRSSSAGILGAYVDYRFKKDNVDWTKTYHILRANTNSTTWVLSEYARPEGRERVEWVHELGTVTGEP